MRALLITLFALFMVIATPAWGTTVGVEIGFSDDETRIIRAYYSSNGGTKARGQGKTKGLPPGIAKNLARGKSLPPGIAKRYLPGDLVASLPPVRGGYERVIIGGKILLIEMATQVIRDVLTDVIL